MQISEKYRWRSKGYGQKFSRHLYFHGYTIMLVPTDVVSAIPEKSNDPLWRLAKTISPAFIQVINVCVYVDSLCVL